MADFEFVQGDTRPFFAVVVKNSLTNAALDLTGTTITFFFKNKRTALGATPKVNGSTVTITDAPGGKCEYRWAATDLDVPGIYEAVFKITHSDAKVQSVRIDNVVVHPKLAP